MHSPTYPAAVARSLYVIAEIARTRPAETRPISSICIAMRGHPATECRERVPLGKKSALKQPVSGNPKEHGPKAALVRACGRLLPDGGGGARFVQGHAAAEDEFQHVSLARTQRHAQFPRSPSAVSKRQSLWDDRTER